jgi:hypothetical protein
VAALVDAEGIRPRVQHGQAHELPEPRGGRGGLDGNPLQVRLEPDGAQGQEDGAGLREPSGDGGGIVQLRVNDLHGRGAEELPGLAGVAHQDAHGLAGLEQALDHGAADPPGGADDGRGHEGPSGHPGSGTASWISSTVTPPGSCT